MKKLKLINFWAVLCLVLIIFMGGLSASISISLKYVIIAINNNNNIFVPLSIFIFSGLLWIFIVIFNEFVEKKMVFNYEKKFKNNLLNYYKEQNVQNFEQFKFENNFIFNSNEIVTKYLISKIKTIGYILSLLIVLIGVFVVSKMMLPILIVLILLKLLIDNYLKNKSSKIKIKYSKNREKYSFLVSDLLLGYDDAASTNKEKQLYSKLLMHNKNYWVKDKKNIKKETKISFTLKMSQILFNLALWAFLIIFKYYKIIGTAELIAFIGMESMVLSFSNNLFRLFYDYSSTKGLYKTCFGKINRENIVILKEIFPIETQNINIKKGDKNFIYQDITINKKDKILLSGDNGSGKSLFIKILLNRTKFNGSASYNKNKANAISLSFFTYYLGAHPMILDISIKQNITLQDNEINKKFIKKYIFLFKILNDLDKNANNLSYGQKQIVALLRILYMNPHLIVIDEGISGLDKDNLFEVEKLLSENDITIIYVSHHVKNNFKHNKQIEMRGDANI